MNTTAPDGWVAGAVLQRLFSRFREGWRELPVLARRRWVRTLAAGYLLLIAFVALLELLGQRLASAGAFDWETDFLRRMEAWALLSFSTGVWLQTLGTDITLALITLFAAAVAAWVRRPLEALSIVAATALLDPAVRLGWLLWERPRPDIVLGGAAAPGFHAFPSGHVAKSLALYGLLAHLWMLASRRWTERAIAWLLALVTVCLVAAARVRIGAHWPSDIVGGAIVGAAWLAVLVLALRRAGTARSRVLNPPDSPAGARPPAPGESPGSLPPGSTASG
jgi:membrane-associated phospholipid phosphatase